MTRLLSSIAAVAIVASSVALLTGQTPSVQQPGAGRGPALPPVVIGPPAPVPAEVAIPRPAPAEIVDVNAAVKKLVDSDKSSSKAAAQEVRVAADAAAAAPERRGDLHADDAADGATARRLRRHREARATSTCCCTAIRSPTGGCRATPTRRCSTSTSAATGRPTSPSPAIPRKACSGACKNGEGQGFQPKAVMVMIGTNNTGATNNAGTLTAAEIAEGVGAVVLELRKDFPDAKILLLAIFPRGVPGDSVRDKIADVNRIISRLDDQKHVFYLDIGAKFLDEQRILPARRLPRRQPAPAGQGLRHLGRGREGEDRRADEVAGTKDHAGVSA